MVKMTTNMGVGVRKNFFEKKANSLLALNITGSLAVAARYKAVKNYIFLVRSQPSEKPTIYRKSLGST